MNDTFMFLIFSDVEDVLPIVPVVPDPVTVVVRDLQHVDMVVENNTTVCSDSMILMAKFSVINLIKYQGFFFKFQKVLDSVYHSSIYNR